MAEPNDMNTRVIAEFRANEGRVGGNFEGAPMILVHHKGRKSGDAHVAPMMYLPGDTDSDTDTNTDTNPETVYVFASKAGAPTNPDWYYNLTATGKTEVEVGSEQYSVAISELTGDARDRVYAEQAKRYPGFAEYEQKTAGVRTIPVLALKRV